MSFFGKSERNMADDSDGEAVPEMADEEIDPEITVDRDSGRKCSRP